MQIVPFLTHYQFVYVNIDIPSFSVISYTTKQSVLNASCVPFVPVDASNNKGATMYGGRIFKRHAPKTTKKILTLCLFRRLKIGETIRLSPTRTQR